MDYYKKYIIYKKKYIILKLGGSNDNFKKLLRQKLVDKFPSFINKYSDINSLLKDNFDSFLNKKIISIQSDQKNTIYNVINLRKNFWEYLPDKIKNFLKESRDENNKNNQNFMNHTIIIDKKFYYVNELDVYNFIMHELKKIYLLELLNNIKEETDSKKKKNFKKEFEKSVAEQNIGGNFDKNDFLNNYLLESREQIEKEENSHKKIQMENNLIEFTNFFDLNIENSKINTENSKINTEPSEIIKTLSKINNSKISEINAEPINENIESIWNGMNKTFKIEETNKTNKTNDKKLNKKLAEEILKGIFSTTEEEDNCKPSEIENMSLYTNDYLEKYLIRNKVYRNNKRINPNDVLTLIRNKSDLKYYKDDKIYKYLDYIIEIDLTKLNIDEWNKIDEKKQKWIQSLRQIDEFKNINGFIIYNINNNGIRTVVNEYYLLSVYEYINKFKKDEGPCSICSLYNEQTKCSISVNHNTFVPTYCVLLTEKENELKLPEEMEGSYYFLTQSNYTNYNEYIISFDEFDKEVFEYCNNHDKLQKKLLIKKKNNEKNMEKNIENIKNENNELDKKIKKSKILSSKLQSISSIVDLGKFITKNLLLTTCTCPFIINNVDATVKILQDINENKPGEYTDVENIFRIEIKNIPGIQKNLKEEGNLDKLEEEYNHYAFSHKDGFISLPDIEWKEKVAASKQRGRDAAKQVEASKVKKNSEEKTSGQKKKFYEIFLDLIPKEKFLELCKPKENINPLYEWILILREAQNNTNFKTCKQLDYYFITKSKGNVINGFGDKPANLGISEKNLLNKIGITENYNNLFNKINNSVLSNTNDIKDNEIYMAFTFINSDNIEYIINFNQFKDIINSIFEKTTESNLLNKLKEFYKNMYNNFKGYVNTNGVPIQAKEINDIFNLTNFNVGEYIKSTNQEFEDI
jgi:hypothetical protein